MPFILYCCLNLRSLSVMKLWMAQRLALYKAAMRWKIHLTLKTLEQAQLKFQRAKSCQVKRLTDLVSIIECYNLVVKFYSNRDMLIKRIKISTILPHCISQVTSPFLQTLQYVLQSSENTRYKLYGNVRIENLYCVPFLICVVVQDRFQNKFYLLCVCYKFYFITLSYL